MVGDAGSAEVDHFSAQVLVGTGASTALATLVWARVAAKALAAEEAGLGAPATQRVKM